MFWGLNFLGNIVVHYNTNSWKLWGTLQRRYKDTSVEVSTMRADLFCSGSLLHLKSRRRCRQGLCRRHWCCNPSIFFDVWVVGHKSVRSVTARQRWSASGALRV